MRMSHPAAGARRSGAVSAERYILGPSASGHTLIRPDTGGRTSQQEAASPWHPSDSIGCIRDFRGNSHGALGSGALIENFVQSRFLGGL